MIKPPAWCKDAIPTPRGWVNPKTKELLKAQKFSESQINEFFGHEEVTVIATPVPIFEAPTTAEEFVAEHAEETVELDLESMSKVELEELGREYGIELDRRHNKEVLIEQLNEVIEWEE